jgi:hypothetical protein
MRFLGLFFAGLLACGTLPGQNVWEVDLKARTIRMDGYTDDWEGVSALWIKPGAPGVKQVGVFAPDDVALSLRALWDKNLLHVAAEWLDNAWDVQRVARQDAVFVTPDQKRRDRMLFFDNLKFQIWDIEADYVLWVSPRHAEQGPFFWHRLLGSVKRLEAASSPPMIAAREKDGLVTLEIQFQWRELKIKPKPGRKLPLTLLLADSDMPGRFLESKIAALKNLEWTGQMRLK